MQYCLVGAWQRRVHPWGIRCLWPRIIKSGGGGGILPPLYLPLWNFEIVCLCSWWIKLSLWRRGQTPKLISHSYTKIFCPPLVCYDQGADFLGVREIFLRSSGAILIKIFLPPNNGICPWWFWTRLWAWRNCIVNLLSGILEGVTNILASKSLLQLYFQLLAFQFSFYFFYHAHNQINSHVYSIGEPEPGAGFWAF